MRWYAIHTLYQWLLKIGIPFPRIFLFPGVFRGGGVLCFWFSGNFGVQKLLPRRSWYRYILTHWTTITSRLGLVIRLCLIPPLRRKVVWIFPHRVAKPRVGKKNFPMSHEWRSHEWQIGKFTIPHFSSVVVCHNYTVSVNLALIS